MNYLIYIEHSAENLQFFLWFRDYQKRFSDLPPSERALAPEWSVEQAEADSNQAPVLSKQQMSIETAAVFKGTDFAGPTANAAEVKHNPFNTPPRTPNGDRESLTPSEPAWSDNASTVNSQNPSTHKNFAKKAAGAFDGADVKWQPCMQISETPE